MGLDIKMLLDPPTRGEIEAAQRMMTPGETMMLSCPIPILDLALAVGAEAADGGRTRDLKAAAAYVYGAATTRDWSGSWLSRRYVAKVRAMRRPLTRGEVDVLERHLALCAETGGDVRAAIVSMLGRGVFADAAVALIERLGLEAVAPASPEAAGDGDISWDAPPASARVSGHAAALSCFVAVGAVAMALPEWSAPTAAGTETHSFQDGLASSMHGNIEFLGVVAPLIAIATVFLWWVGRSENSAKEKADVA